MSWHQDATYFGLEPPLQVTAWRRAHRRIGLGLSYIPTSVRCMSHTRLTAMLVRGIDRYGHVDDEPRQRVDFGAAERAVHADAVARFRASNAEQTSRYASTVR